jgi:hypothetical protein
MARLRRFEENRFIGARDTMVVYDCDDEAQFSMIEQRIESDALSDRRLIQTYGPDTLAEARNRGFTAFV